MAMRLITLGTSHGDAGAPLGNTIYGIDSDQYLRWASTSATANANPSPGLVNWDPNSGNPIGNGWGAVTLFQLGTAGTLMAIHDDGGLYWYRYDGDGHASPSGGAGWDPLSGTKIDDGWGDDAHVMMLLNNGDEVILLTVDSSGTMRPHCYTHGLGWRPDLDTPLPGNLERLHPPDRHDVNDFRRERGRQPLLVPTHLDGVPARLVDGAQLGQPDRHRLGRS